MGVCFHPALSDGVFPSSQGRSVWTRNYKVPAISAARRPVAAAGAAWLEFVRRSLPERFQGGGGRSEDAVQTAGWLGGESPGVRRAHPGP